MSCGLCLLPKWEVCKWLMGSVPRVWGENKFMAGVKDWVKRWL